MTIFHVLKYPISVSHEESGTLIDGFDNLPATIINKWSEYVDSFPMPGPSKAEIAPVMVSTIRQFLLEYED